MYKQTPKKRKGSKRVTTSKRHNPRFASLASICNNPKAFRPKSSELMWGPTTRQPLLPPSWGLPATIAAAADRHTWYFWKPQKSLAKVETFAAKVATCWDHRDVFSQKKSWWLLKRAKLKSVLEAVLLCVAFEVVIWRCLMYGLLGLVRIFPFCSLLLKALLDWKPEMMESSPIWETIHFDASTILGSTDPQHWRHLLTNPACSLAGYKRSGAWITCKRFAWDMRQKQEKLQLTLRFTRGHWTLDFGAVFEASKPKVHTAAVYFYFFLHPAQKEVKRTLKTLAIFAFAGTQTSWVWWYHAYGSLTCSFPSSSPSPKAISS